MGCASNQQIIYWQLVEFQNDNNKLPDDLKVLVEKGYITEDKLYCPNVRRLKDRDGKRSEYAYFYYPENFGDKDKVLISENIHNHYGQGLRLIYCQPVVNEVMGDGSWNRKTLDVEIFK